MTSQGEKERRIGEATKRHSVLTVKVSLISGKSRAGSHPCHDSRPALYSWRALDQHFGQRQIHPRQGLALRPHEGHLQGDQVPV